MQARPWAARSRAARPPPNTVRVVEYYRADLDHYFITANAAETHYLDTFLSGTFKRTGLYFYAYPDSQVAPPGSQPVCRFYASAAMFIDSHYYSADTNECIAVLLNWPGVWTLETASAFYIPVPDAHRHCPARHAACLPLLQQPARRQPSLHGRLVGAPRDAEPRLGGRRQGANGVAFCSPI